jgi:predicted transcriptional regulator
MRISVSIVVLTILGLVVGSSSHAEEAGLLDFELEDQFKNVHRSSDIAGNIVLLIGSDRGGSQFNGTWGKAIHDSLSDHPRYDQISHLAYADLRGVPFFVKGVVRGKFPQHPDQWVLMDWKGIIAKTYDFAPKSANVLVFAPDGALVHHASGREPDEETVSEVVNALSRLLDEGR